MKRLNLIFLAICFLSFGTLLFNNSCTKKKDLITEKTPTVIKSKETDEKTNVMDLRVYEKEDILKIISSVNSSEKGPGWWEKVKKWIKNHSGTHLFDNCNGPGMCGPCPGLCFYIGGIMSGEDNGSDILSSEDYENGLRLFKLSLVENKESGEETLMFTFQDKYRDDFIYNGYLYFPEDTKFNEDLLGLFKKDQILIKAGKYAIVYDEKSRVSQTVVKSIIE